MPFQDTVCNSCGTLTRDILLFRQAPLSGANGSKKLAGCVFLLKTPRRAHDFPLIGVPEPRQPKSNQPTRQARAAFPTTGTRCRYGAIGRFYGRLCHARTESEDQTPELLWASFLLSRRIVSHRSLDHPTLGRGVSASSALYEEDLLSASFVSKHVVTVFKTDSFCLAARAFHACPVAHSPLHEKCR